MGNPAASTILAIAVFVGQVLISGVCSASEEALFVFSGQGKQVKEAAWDRVRVLFSGRFPL